MRVMVLVKATEDSEKGFRRTPETEAAMEAMGRFNDELKKAGILRMADGLKPIPPDASTTLPIEVQRKLPDIVLVHRDGPFLPTPYYPLAVDKVRYVGEAVVLIVAESN